MSSPSRGFSAGVHLAGIISFSLSYKYLLDNHTIVSDSYGWHFQYLTILGLAVAFFTFVSGLLYAFFVFASASEATVVAASRVLRIDACLSYVLIVFCSADLTLSPNLFLLKNSLSLCSAPLEVLISILYWGICAIDKSLVVPPELAIAPVADIGFHLAPALFLTIDLLFLSPPWTINALPAMGLSSIIAVSYWAWVEQCYKHNGL